MAIAHLRNDAGWINVKMILWHGTEPSAEFGMSIGCERGLGQQLNSPGSSKITMGSSEVDFSPATLRSQECPAGSATHLPPRPAHHTCLIPVTHFESQQFFHFVASYLSRTHNNQSMAYLPSYLEANPSLKHRPPAWPQGQEALVRQNIHHRCELVLRVRADTHL